jgi:HemY protein
MVEETPVAPAAPSTPAATIDAKPARPASITPPSEVVFPLPAAPDDPGPEPSSKPRGFRLFG